VPETCIVGVQLAVKIVKALEVRIADRGDVYVNYSMSELPERTLPTMLVDSNI
jgi:hypothetical protein